MKSILSVSVLVFCLLFAGKLFGQSQASIDDKVLQDYFAKNHIKATKTPSGLYYTINKPGSGDNCKRGQAVTMLYYGYTLDGKRFDGNMEKDTYKPAGNAFTFNLGQHQVIAGWDEGVALLNKGSRATLYLPSGLAYGARGAGGAIGPNAVLAFDVEVIAAQ